MKGKGLNFPSLVGAVCSEKKYYLVNKGTFRVRFVQENQFAKVDKSIARRVEDFVTDEKGFVNPEKIAAIDLYGFEKAKNALKEVSQTGYGIILPSTKDMKLEHPEIIKQGNKFGIKLKAKASSIHLIKVDVESSFEPIIGSELQSKELIKNKQ